MHQIVIQNMFQTRSKRTGDIERDKDIDKKNKQKKMRLHIEESFSMLLFVY